MKSPVGKVIGSFLVAGIAFASHAYLADVWISRKDPPITLDELVQFALMQIALHYGVTYGRPAPGR